jgi:hypothetical protein
MLPSVVRSRTGFSAAHGSAARKRGHAAEATKRQGGIETAEFPLIVHVSYSILG